MRQQHELTEMTPVWRLPYVSNGGTRDTVEVRSGRVLALILSAPFDGSDTMSSVSLLFNDVTAYTTRFLAALPPDVGPAFDTLIDLGESEWLRETAKNGGRSVVPTPRKHFRYCLGFDGPCYDVIASSVDIVEESVCTS